MAEPHKMDKESGPKPMADPTTRRITNRLAIGFALVSVCGTFWVMVSASRDDGSPCSASDDDFGQRKWPFIRGHLCGFLLYLSNLWTEEQNAQYVAVKYHSLTRSTEPLRTPRYFWLLPRIQTPLRRRLAIIASLVVLLLQILAVRYAYQGLWTLCILGFRISMYEGSCADGHFVLSRYPVRWLSGTVTLLLALMAWAYALLITLTWVATQAPYLTFLFTNGIRWQPRDPETADQRHKEAGGSDMEKAASPAASDETTAGSHAMSPIARA